jgi:hypothetical protein
MELLVLLVQIMSLSIYDVQKCILENKWLLKFIMGKYLKEFKNEQQALIQEIQWNMDYLSLI